MHGQSGEKERAKMCTRSMGAWGANAKNAREGTGSGANGAGLVGVRQGTFEKWNVWVVVT